MDPNFLIANTYAVLALTGSGRYDEAIDIMRRVEPLAGEHAYTLAAFGESYAMAGQRDEARRMLDQLDELARESRARTSGSKVRGTSPPARHLIAPHFGAGRFPYYNEDTSPPGVPVLSRGGLYPVAPQRVPIAPHPLPGLYYPPSMQSSNRHIYRRIRRHYDREY